jgi:regulatory protein
MALKAYNYAIFLLSKRDYSIYKMRMKLRSREYETEEIEETINKLIEQNYLREEEYKRMRIKTLLIKGYSNSYILRKLDQEKLETNNEAINALRESEHLDKEECINYLVEKKLRGKDIPTEFEPKMKLKNKIMNFLASKGYNYQEAKEAISNYIR